MSSNPYIGRFGTKCWYDEQGERHRNGDLPAIEWKNGDKAWYKHGKRHREQDKPAVEWVDGTKEWWKNGIRHREQDKHAVEYANGEKEWWKNGIELSPHEVEALKRKWTAIRNRDTDTLAEELLNDL